MLKKLKRAFNWYIKGYYHCEHCPYCWSEWSYEGDGDCGCYIRGDIQDTCRLIPPLRFLLGWPRKKCHQYWSGHAYDGYADWYAKRCDQEAAYLESVKILLKKCELYQRTYDGELKPFCLDEFRHPDFPYPTSLLDALDYYEDNAHPFTPAPSLKQQWKELIRKTWDKFADNFRPYFS